VLVALILLAGAVGGAVAVSRSSGELDMTVDRCEIAEDGSLTASGTVSGPSGTGVDVEVEFVDSATGDVVDDADTSIDLGTAPGADPWTVTGTAGDDVMQVTCNATADD
jgi:hypothetical protein